MGSHTAHGQESRPGVGHLFLRELGSAEPTPGPIRTMKRAKTGGRGKDPVRQFFGEEKDGQVQ